VTRVLVLGLRYPPHHTGGYEVSCRDVVERLTQRGHELTVLTSDLRCPGVDDPAGERDAAVPVHRDLRAWFRDEELYAPGPVGRLRMERASQRALREVLDEFRPEVVSAWQMGALSLGLLTTVAERGIPIVYALSDDWLSYALELDAWSRPFRRWPRWVAAGVRRLSGLPTTPPDLGTTGPFCFISEVTRQRAGDYSPWTMADTTIVYSGIDGSLFTPKDPPARDRAWGGRLLYVGRYDPRKGIETAIRALAHLEEATTLEVQGTGDPVERERMVALVRDLGLAARVTFGAVDRATLVERYRDADAFVFPSEWEEPFGLVPLEAMACGTPVVATGVGGSGEFLLDPGNCVRFRAGDPEDLATAVKRLAGDAALRTRLVEAGFRTAAYFDVDALTDSFEAWHAAAATGFRDGRPEPRHFELEGHDGGT
jgi:glycosyltransferase involved in cell wall biosynthesis